MVQENATGLILITRVPQGEAPRWVLEAWVGLELPCHPYLGYADERDRGILSGEELPKKVCGFSVPQDLAIAILIAQRPRAGYWWKEKGFPKPNQCFGFAEDEAQIVRGVTRQQYIHVTEEMQGDPNR